MGKLLKILCFHMVVCVLFSIFYGCGILLENGKNKDSLDGIQQTDTDDSRDEFSPVKDKKYKITWTGYQTKPLGDNPEMIKFFNEKFNVEIQVWNIESKKYDEVLSLKLASGETPDRMWVTNLKAYSQYLNQDVLAGFPLEVLKKYAPNIYSCYQKDIPGVLERYCLIDNTLFGFPMYTDTNSAPLIWRGDWLRKVGIDKTPETLEEFEKAIYKFSKEDPDGNGKTDTYGISHSGLMSVFGAYGYIPHLYSKNNNWYEKNGKLVYGSIQPEMKDALKLISKWFKDGIIDPEYITGENKGGHWAVPSGFMNNKYGVTSLGIYYHWNPPFDIGGKGGSNYEEVRKSLGEAAAVSLIGGAPPVGSGGKRGTLRNPAFTGSIVSLGKHLEQEPDKIGKILTIMDWAYENDENYWIAANGFQGKHWTFDGKTNATVGIKGVDLADIGGYGLIRGTISPFKDTLMKKLPPINAPDYWEEWLTKSKFNKYGISYVTVPSSDSEGKFNVELLKLSDEAYISIIAGEKPIEYFDEYVKKWRAAGGDQIEKEVNEWYSKSGKK